MSESNGQSNGEHKELNAKQLRFCQGIESGLSAKDAYTQAGYSGEGNVAEAAASRMLRSVKIQAYLAKVRAKVEKKMEITVERVLVMLAQKAEMENAAGVRAVELIGQHLGMWPNESKVTVSNLTDEQRISHLNAIFDAARARRSGQASHNGDN